MSKVRNYIFFVLAVAVVITFQYDDITPCVLEVSCFMSQMSLYVMSHESMSQVGYLFFKPVYKLV